jgi:hypothetical protein
MGEAEAEAEAEAAAALDAAETAAAEAAAEAAEAHERHAARLPALREAVQRVRDAHAEALEAERTATLFDLRDLSEMLHAVALFLAGQMLHAAEAAEALAEGIEQRTRVGWGMVELPGGGQPRPRRYLPSLRGLATLTREAKAMRDAAKVRGVAVPPKGLQPEATGYDAEARASMRRAGKRPDPDAAARRARMADADARRARAQAALDAAAADGADARADAPADAA